MKRFALALGLTGALLLGSPAVADTTFVYGSPANPEAPEALALKAFAERVSADSGGKVKFDMSFSGSVVTWGTSLTGVRDSLVDGTFLTPAFNPSELSATFVFILLASTPGDLSARTAAVAETALLNCPQCEAEWRRFKLRPLMFSGSDPFQLMCKPPVNSLESTKGKTVRAAGPFANYVKAMGGTPVAIVPSELFEALQRGQVDCALGGIGWLRQFGLGDVVEHVVDHPLGYDHVRMPLVLNAAVWRGLPKAHRAAFVKNLAFMHAEANAVNTDFANDTIDEAKGKGVKFSAMDGAMKTATSEHREHAFDAAVAAATKMGVKDAEKIVASYKTSLAKWSAIMSEIGDSRSAYEEALHREIYSKLK